uniref:(northern house mosquito) hypothetical protein n=1 Tax=Culex pipiens TaxID=7175 RepID=A0A8D8CX19_CULPI
MMSFCPRTSSTPCWLSLISSITEQLASGQKALSSSELRFHLRKNQIVKSIASRFTGYCSRPGSAVLLLLPPASTYPGPFVLFPIGGPPVAIRFFILPATSMVLLDELDSADVDGNWCCGSELLVLPASGGAPYFIRQKLRHCFIRLDFVLSGGSCTL